MFLQSHATEYDDDWDGNKNGNKRNSVSMIINKNLQSANETKFEFTHNEVRNRLLK